jgi:hypothetical protein
MKRRVLISIVAVLPLLGGIRTGRAQWVTQSFDLKSGWNAVYLHVDASHDTLANLVAADVQNPILEIWLWAPPSSTLQYIQSPQQPVDTGSEWMSWVRASSDSSGLQCLGGNAAYLVRVAANVASYTWSLKGKPLPPAYEWTTKGLNFLGFPTVPAGPPNFDAFLANIPDFQQNAEIYQYRGGELCSTNPQNPHLVVALRTTLVNRGQAYWIRSGSLYNRYFAPFELAMSGAQGVSFGESLNTFSFRLRNLTATNLAVTLRLIASETPPAGQTDIVGLPPLLIRGALNTTNLTYGYYHLAADAPHAWTLAPAGLEGAETEVVLGLDRASMTNNVGDLLAGVLRLTDSLGHCQVDLPVSATMASSAGLWVGSAAVTQVGQYLKSYERDAANNLVVASNGQYVVASLNTNLGAVAYPFPLRLIAHNPESGSAVLLQRVYVGSDAATNLVVANQESALSPALLSQARRISAAHLPWTQENTGWALSDRFGRSTNLTATVTLNFDNQASNPFLHTYHPDHDNLDAKFKNALPQGAESYTIQRGFTLSVTPPADDFASLTAAGHTFTGNYAETIKVLGLARAGGTNDTRSFEVRGAFVLHLISSVPTLTLVP